MTVVSVLLFEIQDGVSDISLVTFEATVFGETYPQHLDVLVGNLADRRLVRTCDVHVAEFASESAGHPFRTVFKAVLYFDLHDS